MLESLGHSRATTWVPSFEKCKLIPDDSGFENTALVWWKFFDQIRVVRREEAEERFPDGNGLIFPAPTLEEIMVFLPDTLSLETADAIFGIDHYFVGYYFYDPIRKTERSPVNELIFPADDVGHAEAALDLWLKLNKLEV